MKKRSFFRRWGIVCLVFFTVSLMFETGWTQDSLSGDWAGIIVRIQGRVGIISSQEKEWQPAGPGTLLRPGDMISTDQDGWAGIIFSDESMVQLNKNSLLIIKQVAPKAGWLEKIKTAPGSHVPDRSEYLLKKGHLWFRNKNKDQHVDIQTPYVSTSIRGTELDIRITDTQTVTVSVLEGEVAAFFNEKATRIQAQEQLTAGPGSQAVRQVLIQPAGRVQWTLSVSSTLDLLSSGTPLSTALSRAVSYMLDREYEAAMAYLSGLDRSGPDASLIWSLESLIHLIANDTFNALEAAGKAVQADQKSPVARLVQALAYQSRFDLEQAVESTQTALALNPEFIGARLNLAKLAFGRQDMDQADQLVNAVLSQAPDNGQALTLKGFLLLSTFKTVDALSIFEKAVKQNQARGLISGEPHLGLALAWMRRGCMADAFKEITTAVLLEPQRSLFLSYWAKMLYEARRFKQSLDILNQAKLMDPDDPTPWLYQALIYKDLNRYHESIQAMQTAIELNDNRAVYRSRMLLDKDLAVKNVNLALIYKQLGMSEWGLAKAIKSLKQDNNNFAAHRFLADQLEYLQGYNGFGARSARLKAFLMQPANLNTFNTFNDYTAFLEKPALGGTLAAYVGNMGYLDKELKLFGAMPDWNISFDLKGETFDSDGRQEVDWQDACLVEARGKWDISHRDTLSGSLYYKDVSTGDLSVQTSYDESPDSQTTADSRLANFSLGYLRKLSLHTDLLFHVKRQYINETTARTHTSGSGVTFISAYEYDYVYNTNTVQWLDAPFTIIQAMQTTRVETHQLSFGGMYYESDRDYRITATTVTDLSWEWSDDTFSFTETDTVNSNLVKDHLSVYIQDIWNPAEKLTLEGALYVDKMKNANSLEKLTWSQTLVNPRIGMTYRPTPRDSIAVSWYRYLEPYESVDRIDSIDVAGHVLSTFYEGALVEETDLGFQHEWSRGLVMTRIFRNEPDYTYKTMENDTPITKTLKNRYTGVETAVNQLLSDDMGLAAGYTFFDIDQDQATPGLEGRNHWGWARLTKGLANGLTLSAGISYYHTNYEDDAVEDQSFLILASFVEYELPKKLGKLRFEINNICNEHFNGTPLSDAAGLLPERFFMVMARVNF